MRGRGRWGEKCGARNSGCGGEVRWAINLVGGGKRRGGEGKRGERWAGLVPDGDAAGQGMGMEP